MLTRPICVVAHSVNPNYAAKYEPDHKPEMNKGTVIKINANARVRIFRVQISSLSQETCLGIVHFLQSRHVPKLAILPQKTNTDSEIVFQYATNSPGIALVEETARRARVPLQLFVVRNDSSCGSTIGPMLSAALGTRTLDLGNAQLSMHSIRETGGIYDVGYAIKLFESFFVHYTELGGSFIVDQNAPREEQATTI